MKLIIGGAYQGKLTWAVETFRLAPEDLWDLAQGDPVPGKKCYYHLEALTRRCKDWERYLPLFADAVVIGREIGSGVVPLDPVDRAWRERHGTALRCLAREADQVTRIFCGLPEVLK